MHKPLLLSSPTFSRTFSFDNHQPQHNLTTHPTGLTALNVTHDAINKNLDLALSSTLPTN